MNQREKKLAAAIVVLVALFAGYKLYARYTESLHARQAEKQDAEAKLQDANLKLAEGRNAIKKMEAWQQRSLPSNVEKASSLYKAWLLAKATGAGLTVNDIKLTPTTNNSAAFKSIGYQLVAGGSLSNVTAMLYEFYHSPQLHQITRLQLSRPPGSSQLQVTLDVEALSLKGAVAADKLPDGDSKRLKLASVDDYKKSMGERDLATTYSPPRPPGPPRERRESPAPPKFDDSDLAFFTASVSSDKGLQAWINVRTTNETLHLVAGDPVKVGALDGEIVSVEPRSLVYKAGDKKFRVTLGQSLRKGKELDAKGEAKSSPPTEPPKS